MGENVATFRSRAAAFAGALLLVGGCSKDSTGISAPVTGSWSGTTSQTNASISFVMTLTENSGGQITGTGSGTGLGGMGGSVMFNVGGTRSGTSVSLTLAPANLVAANFTGKEQDANTISGELNNSGFSHVPLTLRR